MINFRYAKIRSVKKNLTDLINLRTNQHKLFKFNDKIVWTAIDFFCSRSDSCKTKSLVLMFTYWFLLFLFFTKKTRRRINIRTPGNKPHEKAISFNFYYCKLGSSVLSVLLFGTLHSVGTVINQLCFTVSFCCNPVF